MDVLAGPYYFYCKTFLGVFGVWSLNNVNANRFLRFLTYITCLTMLVPCLCKAYELRRHFYYFLLCVPILTFYLQFYIKFTYLIYKASQFRQLIELVRNDFRSYTGKNLEILHQYARTSMKFSRFYACNYNLMALHSLILDMFIMTLIIGVDVLLLNCTQHSCALFKIVVREITHLFEPRNYKLTNGSQSLLYKEMSRVIELHKHALHYANLIETTYATLQLLITGVSLVTITLSEFEVAINKAHQEMRFRFIVYHAAESLHILFHNYPGQRVRDHSLMIYQSCYESEWYREDVPNECKKLMNLMMLRSQHPCYLTGGGLYVLGLENYATILKASVSYFTFLASIL